MDSLKKSITKAISWRAISTLITFAIIYYVTGDPGIAGLIALSDSIVKFFTYLGHERIWESRKLNNF